MSEKRNISSRVIMGLSLRFLISALVPVVVLLLLVHINLIAFTDIPAWVALILSIFGIYYASESLVMDIKIKHSEDLHRFISDWKRINTGFYTNVIPNYTAQYRRGELDMNKSQYNLEVINQDILYEDLIENHLENKYKYLKEEWRRYNQLVKEFEVKLDTLRQHIEDLILKELKKKGLQPVIGYGYIGTETMTPNFADMLFLHYAGAIKEKQQLQMQEMNYSIPATGSMAKGYDVMAIRQNGNFRATIATAKEEGTAKVYISVFDNLQNESNTQSDQLRALIKEIKDADLDIDKHFNKISKALVDLDKYPVFGEKCSFIKRAL